MSQAALKIADQADVIAGCIHCDAQEHTLLFRRAKHDVVECDNCGFAYVVGGSARDIAQDV